MTPEAKRVLGALAESSEFTDPRWYFPFKPLMKKTGLDRRTVRRQCRFLARKGYAEFSKGLWTEDGEVAGAGYCITKSGRDALAEIARRAER